MKYPVWPKTHASEIPSEINEIHLVRPLPSKKIIDLVSSKRIDRVFASKSTLKRLSKKTKNILKEKNISLEAEEKRGRPLDIPLEKVKEVVELHKDHQSFRKIEKLTGIPKSTIHYLIKYAARNKIKGDKKILYV